jgi:hypothetical protein
MTEETALYIICFIFFWGFFGAISLDRNDNYVNTEDNNYLYLFKAFMACGILGFFMGIYCLIDDYFLMKRLNK